MNKKGFVLSFELVWWIPKILYTILIVVTVVAIMLNFIVTNLDVSGTEAQVIMNRVLYSPNGINYYDSAIKRSYPGVIDLNRFTSAQLDNIIMFDNPPIAIRANLTYEDTSAATYKEWNRTIYYHKDDYDDWLPLAEAGIRGYGGAMMHITTQNVVVKVGSEFVKGRLQLKVITKYA